MPILRTLEIKIDKATWAAPTAFPGTFHNGVMNEQIDIEQMLLLMGYLTTPHVASAARLSQYWAFVRYLAAIAAAADFRITTDFSDLDAHQKAVLSDDFGVAVPLYWLWTKLNLRNVYDGRYFVAYLARGKAILPPKLHKHGPRKCPDFVCVDQSNRWHIIECKGTQSGYRTRDGLLNNALSQKAAVSILPPLKGQTLATGLAIAEESRQAPSQLKIVDPEHDPLIQITSADRGILQNVETYLSVGRVLSAAGLVQTGREISIPAQLEAKTPYLSRSERRILRRSRSEEATAELASAKMALTPFRHGDDKFLGRSIYLDMPKLVYTDDGRRFTRLNIRQGVNEGFVKLLSNERALEVEAVRNISAHFSDGFQIKIDRSRQRSRLFMGSLYFSELAPVFLSA